MNEEEKIYPYKRSGKTFDKIKDLNETISKLQKELEKLQKENEELKDYHDRTKHTIKIAKMHRKENEILKKVINLMGKLIGGLQLYDFNRKEYFTLGGIRKMELKEAIEILTEFKKTGYCTLMIKHNWDIITTNKKIEYAIDTVLEELNKE